MANVSASSVQGLPFVTPNMSEWTSYAASGSWVTNTSYVGRWKREVDSMRVRVKVSVSGAPNATVLTVNLPSGYSIDTSKVDPSVNADNFGTAHILDAGVTHKRVGCVVYLDTTSVTVLGGTGTSGSDDTSLTHNTFFTFASGDGLWLDFTVPILQWTNQGHSAQGAGISATNPSLVKGGYEEYVDSGVFRAASQVGADVTGSSYALSATRIGKTVHLRITGGSGSSSAQSTLYCQNLIPASMRPDTLILGPTVVYSGSSICRVRVNSTGVVELTQYNASFAATNIPNSTILYALLVSYNLT